MKELIAQVETLIESARKARERAAHDNCNTAQLTVGIGALMTASEMFKAQLVTEVEQRNAKAAQANIEAKPGV